MDQTALQGYGPAPKWTRYCDGLSVEDDRPVILGYHFDLLRLQDLDGSHAGFQESPIVLCFDYQREAIQSIVGALIEVRTFDTGGKTQ